MHQWNFLKNATKNQKVILKCIFSLVLLLAVIKVSFNLILLITFAKKDLLNGDVLIYLTMGRGILNGLVPYIDLFESKPPLIFYLSAISLWFSNGAGLLKFFEVVNLLFLPLCCMLLAQPNKRLIGFLLGGLLALRSFENAGGAQSEIFGILPAGLYIVTLFSNKRSWNWVLLRGVLILLSVGIREPYIIGILAAALLFSKKWEDLWELLVLPCFAAFIIGTTILLLSGLLEPYLFSYLPAMIKLRIAGGQPMAGGVVDPTLWRILWVHRFFASLSKFSTMPLLGYIIGCLYLIVTSQKETDKKQTFLTSLSVAGGILLIHYLFILTVILSKTGQIGMTTLETLTHATFLPISFIYLIGFIIYFMLLFYVGKSNQISLFYIVCSLLAVLLLNYAVGIGGYLWNYMLYAIPAILLCFIAFLRSKKMWTPVVALIIIAALGYQLEQKNLYSQTQGTVAKAIEHSASLDNILNACNVKRYVFVGEFPIFAFAKHSPIGTIFTLYFQDYLGFDHPLYLKTWQSIIDENLIWFESKESATEPDPFPSGIRDLFSSNIPSCAQGLKIPEGFIVKYKI